MLEGHHLGGSVPVNPHGAHGLGKVGEIAVKFGLGHGFTLEENSLD